MGDKQRKRLAAKRENEEIEVKLKKKQRDSQKNLQESHRIRKCRHYELRVFPDSEQKNGLWNRLFLPPIIREIPSKSYYDWTYVVVGGGMIRRLQKKITGTSWIQLMKKEGVIEYVCACCGHVFTKEEATRMDKLIAGYENGKCFSGKGECRQKMKGIHTSCLVDLQEKTMCLEEPKVICGPYTSSEMQTMKMSDFFKTEDVCMTDISEVHLVSEKDTFQSLFLSLTDENPFRWHEALGTFLKERNIFKEFETKTSEEKEEKSNEKNG